MSAANNTTNQGTSIPHEVNKLALVVGVNNSSIAPYRSTLKYAEQDARYIASLLQQPACSFNLLIPALTGQEMKNFIIASNASITKKNDDLRYCILS
jgi:hypothetical protein